MDTPTIRTLFLGFSLFCCFIGFASQVHECILKYFNKATTISQYKDTPVQDTLPFPAFTICPSPAFNQTALGLYGINLRNWDILAVADQENGAKINVSDWDLMTFSENDVFAPKKVSIATDTLADDLTTSGLFKTVAVSSFYFGKCYTITTNVSLQTNKAIIVNLKYPWTNVDPRNVFKIYIHQEEETPQIISQFWVSSQPTVVEVVPGTMVDIALVTQKHEYVPGDSSCQEHNMSHFMSCYMNMVERSLNYSCKFPAIIRGHEKINNLPDCTLQKEIVNYAADLSELLTSITEQCKTPCSVKKYEVGTRDFHWNTTDYLTKLWIVHGDNVVKVYKEVPMYDFNAIVGTVGGSLGLFIGFSVYEFIKVLFDFVKSKMSSDDR